MEHHHMHNGAPLHWGYSATPPHHNTWVPPQTRSGGAHKRTISESDCEDLFSETSSSKDQTSPKDSDSCQHQSRKKRRGVIEKKRRDRINVSLIELKRLVPSAFEKQGSAKLEKAEILQLTVDHLKMLHAKGFAAIAYDPHRFAVDYNNIGYRECVAEVARYLTNVEGMDAQEPLRQRLLDHLQCNMTQREMNASQAAAQSTAASVAPASGTATGAWPAPPPPPSGSGAYHTASAAAPQHHHHQHQQHQQQQQQASTALSTHAPASGYSSSLGYHQQQQQTHAQHQQYSSVSASTSLASTSSASNGGYVPNLSPSLAQQQQQQQQQTASGHTSTSASASTATTSTTNTTSSTSRPEHTDSTQLLHSQQLQQHQQQQHHHQLQQQQQQQLQQVQHHQLQQNHHYPPLIGHDGHPIAPTYIDISQSTQLRHAATADAVAGYAHYGAPGSAAQHAAYTGSKPYRPWGAEMAY